MMTCPYCASELLDAGEILTCRFCEMNIALEDAQQDGRRKPLPEMEYTPPETWAKSPTPELMTYSTIELIFLLRYARQNRASSYNYVRLFNKAGDVEPSLLEEHQASVQATKEDYEYWTRKAWVIENILRERTGDYPAKITEKYLAELLARIKASNAKPMGISKSRRKHQGSI